MASRRGPILFVLFALAVGAAGVYVWRTELAETEQVDDVPDEAPLGPDAGPRKGKKGGGKRRPAAAKKGSNGDTPRAPPAPIDYGPPGTSYEAAIASNHQQLTIGAHDARPDLTDAQLSGPMRNGTFLDECGAPESTSVQVKVAIRDGRAVGVSVFTRPPNTQVAACVDHAVRGLAWPSNPKMDSFVTTY